MLSILVVLVASMYPYEMGCRPQPLLKRSLAQRAERIVSSKAAATATAGPAKPALDWDNLGFGIQGVAPVGLSAL